MDCEAAGPTVRCWKSQALRMLVATLGKIPLFLLCSLSLSGSSSSPVLGDAMPLSRQSPETNTGESGEELRVSKYSEFRVVHLLFEN